MPTFMQKIQLAIRGWNRRRDEKQQEFLKQNTAWSGGAQTQAVSGLKPASTLKHIDVEGLTVAYLDDSGHFQHYLDIESGDVINAREPLTGERYRRVPSHRSDEDERRDFITMVEDSGDRARLASAAENFRSEIARDRALERAWYNFRNDRAIAAIQKWLREIGVK
jgi:hypothetical protein